MQKNSWYCVHLSTFLCVQKLRERAKTLSEWNSNSKSSCFVIIRIKVSYIIERLHPLLTLQSCPFNMPMNELCVCIEIPFSKKIFLPAPTDPSSNSPLLLPSLPCIMCEYILTREPVHVCELRKKTIFSFSLSKHSFVISLCVVYFGSIQLE
jgi:hypothetical protein